MPETINFYNTGDEYGEFSNFAPYPILLDGKTWLTSELYFQAQKFVNEGIQENIRRSKTPMIAARMGRDRSKPLRPDWEMVKDDIMRKAVRAKFTLHEGLKKKLLDTGDATIVEHTDRDSY